MAINEFEIKKIVWITALLILAITSLILWFGGAGLFSKDGLSAVSSAVTITAGIWGVFIKWGWRWPILSLLFSRPDLNGTWIGQFNTDWTDENGDRPRKLPFVAVIRQNYLAIYVTTHTKNFVGHSYCVWLDLNLDHGEKQLVYLYAKDRISIGLPGNREGVAQFRIMGTKATELKGQYWSKEKTAGFIALKKVGSYPVDSFEEAQSKWKQRDEWHVELPEL